MKRTFPCWAYHKSGYHICVCLFLGCLFCSIILFCLLNFFFKFKTIFKGYYKILAIIPVLYSTSLSLSYIQRFAPSTAWPLHSVCSWTNAIQSQLCSLSVYIHLVTQVPQLFVQDYLSYSRPVHSHIHFRLSCQFLYKHKNNSRDSDWDCTEPMSFCERE